MPRPRHLSTGLVLPTGALSPDGRLAATAGWDGVVRLYETVTGRPHLVPLRLQANGSVEVLFSPDGKALLTHVYDPVARSERNFFDLWVVETGRAVASWKGGQETSFRGAAAFSPNGRLVVAPAEGKKPALQMRSLADGAAVGEPLPSGEPVFSPDGRFLLLCGFRPSLWNTVTRQRIGELPGPLFPRGAAFSPDSTTLLTATSKEAHLWKTSTGEVIGEPLRHTDHILAAVFTTDGKTAWTASMVESRSWDPATGKPLGEPLHHPTGVTRVVFGPGRRTVLLALGDRRFVACDLQTRKPAYEPVEAPGAITSVNRDFTQERRGHRRGALRRRLGRGRRPAAGQGLSPL